MSAPARALTSPRPIERAVRHGPVTPPRRKRKQHRLGFAVFASGLVGSIVLGIVVLHALLAQQSFRIAEAERTIDELGVERLELVRAQATLSAPGRIADWAFRHDMRLPDDIRILRAPEGSGDPSGADTTAGNAAAGAMREKSGTARTEDG